MKADKLRIVREAGHVMRAHNVYHHGEYSVGLHSYGVVSILLILHPSPRMELIRAAMWHDMPERFLGDLPAPSKWYNANLAEEYRRAEQIVLDKFGEPHLESCLTPQESWWLRGADRLELLMWCDDQLAMGNQHVANVRKNVLNWFSKNQDDVPAEIMREVKAGVWYRHEEKL